VILPVLCATIVVVSLMNRIFLTRLQQQHVIPFPPIHLPFTGKKSNKGYNMGRSGNGGGVITPNFTKKKNWVFTYWAFGKSHTIPLGTALGIRLKEEAERRREEYSDLDPLVALLEYAHAQDNESEFAITDEEWEHFIEEMNVQPTRVSTRKRKEWG